MPQIDTDRLLLIVVGVHLNAEAGDRPLAYQLQKKIELWLTEHGHSTGDLKPMVCADVWYLNHASLQQRPVISIGGPGVNALSAYLYQRLTTVLSIDEQLAIQLDPEMKDLRCSIWGMNHRHTAASVQLFEDRYLDIFLHTVTG